MTQYLGTNGYTYEKNKDGSYSTVGTARPSGMSAQEQYDAANSGAFSSFSRDSSGDVSAFAGTFGRFSVSDDRANLFSDGSSGSKPVKSAGTGAGAGSVSTGKAAAVSTGPGNPGVSTSGRRVSGPGGSRLQVQLTGVPWDYDALGNAATPPGPYETTGPFVKMGGPSDVSGRKFPLFGLDLEANPYSPPAQIIEDEMGEGEFLSPTWFANWGKIVGDAGWNINRAFNALSAGRVPDRALVRDASPYPDAWPPRR